MSHQYSQRRFSLTMLRPRIVHRHSRSCLFCFMTYNQDGGQFSPIISLIGWFVHQYLPQLQSILDPHFTQLLCWLFQWLFSFHCSSVLSRFQVSLTVWMDEDEASCVCSVSLFIPCLSTLQALEVRRWGNLCDGRRNLLSSRHVWYGFGLVSLTWDPIETDRCSHLSGASCPSPSWGGSPDVHNKQTNHYSVSVNVYRFELSGGPDSSTFRCSCLLSPTRRKYRCEESQLPPHKPQIKGSCLSNLQQSCWSFHSDAGEPGGERYHQTWGKNVGYHIFKYFVFCLFQLWAGFCPPLIPPRVTGLQESVGFSYSFWEHGTVGEGWGPLGVCDPAADTGCCSYWHVHYPDTRDEFWLSPVLVINSNYWNKWDLFRCTFNQHILSGVPWWFICWPQAILNLGALAHFHPYLNWIGS